MNDVRLEYREIGPDILLIITGGDAHIGAVSTAYASPEFSVEVRTSSVPGHKEYLLSEDFALRACKRLSRTVTVVMGIHYDNLNSEQIEHVCQLAEKAFTIFLQMEAPPRYDMNRIQ